MRKGRYLVWNRLVDSRQGLRGFAVVLALVLMVWGDGADQAAFAQTGNSGAPLDAVTPPTGFSFSASVPPEPVLVRPGDQVQQTIRIGNNEQTSTTFTLKVISVNAGDEGSVTPAEDRDDPITHDIQIDPQAAVAAQSLADFPVTVTIPRTTLPDIYLVGIAVQPIPTAQQQSGNLQQATRIVDTLAINVVGDAARRVQVDQQVHPRLLITGKLSGRFSVYNSGAGVSFGRTVYLDHRFGDRELVPPPAHTQQNRETLVSQRRKSFSYTWTPPAFTIDVVRPLIEISYEDTGTGKTVTTRWHGPSVVVISPLAIGAAAAVILVVLALLGRFLMRLRRRRLSRQPRQP